MKNFGYLLIAALIFSSSCKKSDDNVTCDTPTLNIALADKQVTLSGSNSDGVDEYYVEYGPAGFSKGSGTTVSFSGGSTTINITDYGNYDFYVRAKCGNNYSDWSGSYSANVDGGYSSCYTPSNFDVNTTSYSVYQLEWYGSGNYYDVEYGPTGFVLGNGTRLRTNNTYTRDQIMQAGVTYDFYVRANCGGNTFSSWGGPRSVYSAINQNITVPCTQPTALYAYRTSSTEINFTAQGHGSISYEVSISTSNTSMTSNILSYSSPNGAVYNSGGFSGTRYCWMRGKCFNGSFTNWTVALVN